MRKTLLMIVFLSLFSLSFVQSGARINISDGACQERIVTITGSPESIHTAFTLITKKLEEVSPKKIEKKM